ncbi:MAG: KEOPS complex subunit Pcc1 [Thermoplasmata archaeon]
MRRTYGSAEVAERLARALAPDHDGFVRCAQDGATLEFRIEAPTPTRARATIEDLLACLGSAERTSGITSARREVP